MGPLHPPLGDKLSDTDPISNSVVITGLDFARDGANLLRPGRYPGSCLNSYIHESLHHMCFRSPVGSAIAYLYHRGFQRAADHLVLGDTSEYDEYDVLDDIVRAEALIRMMRPLAEGIALFGEFDAFPGDAKSRSPVFLNTANAFSMHVAGSEKLSIDDVLRRLLGHGRSSRLGRHRKENLLMQDFTTHNGGYLPGYLLVKNFQFALFRQLGCRKFLDSEFYLHFVINWFYSDFNLVRTLLDSSKTLSPFDKDSIAEHDAHNAISTAYQVRMKELFARLTVEQVECFDELMAGEDRVPWWKIQIGTDPVEAKLIEEKLRTDTNHLIDFSRPGSPGQRISRAICYDSIIRRDYMCIGSFLEDIEIDNTGATTIAHDWMNEKRPVMVLGRSEKKGPYRGKAVVDVLQSSLSGRVFITVYADDERVIMRSVAQDFEEEQKSLGSTNLSTERCRLIKAWMRDTIDKVTGKDTTAGMFREHYKRCSAKFTEAVYHAWCGAVVGPEAELGEDSGTLLALAGRDTKFLRTIAALGCVGSPIFTDTTIAECCGEQGLAVVDFMARVQEIEKKCKFRFLIPVGRNWVLSV